MLRKARILIALFSIIVYGRPSSAENLRVLPEGEGGSALKEYLLKECGKCFERRGKIVAALVTPEAIVERQKKLKSLWLDAVGEFPERTPLNARTVGTLGRDGYRIEKIIYESRPRHHVTANLYLPARGKPPFPGILIPCGHSRNGKAAGAYQSIAISLALNGFVALCYDPIGQGERYQTLDEKGKPITGGTTEHTLVDIGARLVGWSAATYRIWDGIRSIDYLVSRPEVDSEKIGCTGNSGGGTMTSYLMVTDDRIYAAAPSCYITSLERLFATIGPQDGEQNITAQVALGIDHADYLSMRAPKPTLVLTATRDFFDIDGSWRSFREAKRLYGILGFGERVDIFEYPDTHGFSKPRRQAALRWMSRWLKGIDAPVEEPQFEVNTDADLQVTKSGQVLYDLKGRSVWDITAERAKELAKEREKFWRENPKAECISTVKRLCGIRLPVGSVRVLAKGKIEREKCVIEKIVIEREGEVPIPALRFVPKDAQGQLPGVLYVDGRGKAHDAAPEGRVEKLCLEGRVVLTIDVRGFGETAPVKPRRYWHNEYPVSYLAIHLGRPLLGQRVEDALSALEVLASDPGTDPRKLSAVGIEGGGLVVLHAAVLDERLGEISIERAIESWIEVVLTPLCRNQLNQVVPGALKFYDLPDLVRALGPRRVTVKDPVDPKGEPKFEFCH